MLEKTIKLISSYPPGTYVPDNVECYDVDEVMQFGALLSRLTYSPSSLRKIFQERFGVTITRSDFYSEIPRISEIENSFKSSSLLTLDQIFPTNEVMINELKLLMPTSEEFSPPKTTSSPHEYAWEGGPFSYSDAMAYYTMIRTRKPSTILEIGSGWSTRIALEACKKNGHGRIICVEPYPSDDLRTLPNIELIEKRAQELNTNFFNETISSDGDMLFIDSTHTVKHDSDCLHIYLRILPNINKRITVHVHDIFLPNTLSIAMMRDHQLFWNEQYLLYIYLITNPKTRVLYSSSYHHKHNRELIDGFMHGRCGSGGGSFWFDQMGSPLRDASNADERR